MGEVDEDKRGGGGLDLGFALPQKLIRTDEYLFGSTSTSPPTVSIGGPPLLCSKGGVCDAQGAPAAATRANPFRSQAVGHGGIAPGMRFPLFTPAQWQELQRQALIYKHLVASVPIPIDLLFDSRGFQTTPSLYPTMAGCGGGGVYYGLRFSADNADPEPGRCRRTDGKKWRCTRDAAPDQKYCERHMHRGRPRSRKPVERSPKNASTSSTHSSTDVVNPSGGTITITNAAGGQGPPGEPLAIEACAPLPRPEVKFPFLSTATEKETSRHMDWMKGAVEGVHSNGTTVPQSYHHDEDPCCYSFLNPEAASLDHPRKPRRFFIDAWSVEGHSVPSAAGANHEALRDETCAKASPGGLSASTLTLTMSGSGEDRGHVRQMGLPTLGGPLGEVLRSSSVASPRDGSGGTCENGGGYFDVGLASLVEKSRGAEEGVSPRESPPPRVLPSSPTAVLQRTLVSLSDSSSNSSPTFAAGGGGRSELGLQWTCHAKKW